ncbi:vacuolar iron transporter 1-like [Pyrus x bretschneideri]|uniref:vacuolar iron transporter 1-like n=1 Tax=Pyrus x bretschneideri TaxID=225117 RepID=UPI00202E1A20|nr:vacuolar iron transporter 1-like [Pyrus x bretschneideri]
MVHVREECGAVKMPIGEPSSVSLPFELGLEKPDPRRALHSALTIVVAYVLGGAVPLLPYVFFPRAKEALVASVVVTLQALLIFGYAKGSFTDNKPFRSAFQTALIGAIASAAAFGLAKAIHP